MATTKKIVLTAEDRTKPAFRSAQRNMSKLEGVASGLSKAMAVLGGATAVALVARSFINAADRATQLENKLKLVTTSSENLSKVYGELFELSKSTRVSFEATSELYARLARSSDHLGLSEAQLLQITESLNQAFAVSGAGIMETASAVRQLGQGLASGTLRGDELRSVMENTPRVARMIAEGMGTTIGQLRILGSEGKLNAQTVTKAILNQTTVIQREYDKTQGTVSQASQAMSDSWMNFVNVVDDSTGTSGLITTALERMSRGLDKISRKISGEDPFGLYGKSVKQLREELKATEEAFERFHKLPKQVQELSNVKGGDIVLFTKMSAIREKISKDTGQTVKYNMEVTDEVKKQVIELEDLEEIIDLTNQDLQEMGINVEGMNSHWSAQKDFIEAGTKSLGDRLDMQDKLRKQLKAIDSDLADHNLTTSEKRIKQIKRESLKQRDINANAFLSGAQDFEEYETRKKEIAESTAEQIDQVRTQEQEKEKAINNQRLTSAIGTTTAMASALKDESRELFYFWKAMAIAEATINTYNAATSAMKIPYVGPFLAGSMIALGFMYVNKIRQMEPPARQYGGPVIGGKSYLVGEKGPELFTPGKSGQVSPNGSSGGDTNITFRITALNAKGIDQLLQSRKDMIIGMINESRRRNLRAGI
tara:strand:+ start:6170 stop:8128 length:1959 start_codon:yes stop_codon:yes gene_type:complete